jgi:hypothetical protein
MVVAYEHKRLSLNRSQGFPNEPKFLVFAKHLLEKFSTPCLRLESNDTSAEPKEYFCAIAQVCADIKNKGVRVNELGVETKPASILECEPGESPSAQMLTQNGVCTN